MEYNDVTGLSRQVIVNIYVRGGHPMARARMVANCIIINSTLHTSASNKTDGLGI